MSLEDVGAAATAGLAAGAIARRAGKAGEAHIHCADCGAELTGRFCANCGQPAHIHRSLLHLGEELLHGVMHFDGRIWRTLPMLLFRPGTLTRNWVHGKRSRYVSPLAIFLFTLFVMFMALSYLPHEPPKSLAQAQAETAARLAKNQARLAKAEQALAAAPAKGEAHAEADEKASELRADVRGQEKELAGMQQAAALGMSGDWRHDLGAESTRANINTGDKKLDAKIDKAMKNPEYALYKLQQSFYKFSFLLVPLSIPFVALLFLWKRGFTLYDHGVFILYSITFVSLAFMLIALATRFGGPIEDPLVLALLFAIPVHMFFQLKGAYGLKTGSALWRTFVLLVFCNVALGLFATAVVVLTFA
jgi:hypothetical protein